MTEEAQALSPEEQELLTQFREQMAKPEGERQAVSVVNESLGQSPTGIKIQFRPGEGEPYMPAPPKSERWQLREQRTLEAMEHARLRADKNRKSMVVRVKDQGEKLNGRNVKETTEYLHTLSKADQEVALLAEEHGDNRATVVKSFPPVSRSVREQYQAELDVIEEMTKT
jgi:hypothetical protein